MNKVLLIFPPAWNPTAPYLSLPLLLGELHSENIPAKGFDINAEFYNDILNSKFIIKLYNTIDDIILIIRKILKNKHEYNFLNSDSLKSKLNKLELLKQKNNAEFKIICNYIDWAVLCLKSEQFYNPENLYFAQNIVNKTLEFISLCYFPYTLTFSNLLLDKYTEDYETIKNIINDENLNPFLKYYKNKLKNIDDNINIIGISVAGSGQLIPALTLSKYLKENFNIKIILGGNFFLNLENFLLKNSDFFKTYADYVLLSKDSKSLTELINAIHNQNDLLSVPNLVHMYNDKIIFNSTNKTFQIKEIAPISFSGFDLKKYISPEIVMPYQLSSGCPWGKCSYCSFHFKEKYQVKNISTVVDELYNISEKYSINKFYFVDDAITLKYFEKFTDSILAKDLNINFYSYSRVESNFNEFHFKKLYMAGLRLLQWGIETADKNIFNLMNKGVDFTKRTDILNLSNKQKIWNHIFIIFGFPTETFLSAQNTIDYIEKNRNIMNSFSVEPFHLLKNTDIEKNYSKYGIKKIFNDNNLSSALSYETDNSFSNKDLYYFMNLFYNKFIKPKLKEKHLANIFISSNYLFLYLCKYGYDFVTSYKIDKDIVFEKIRKNNEKNIPS